MAIINRIRRLSADHGAFLLCIAMIAIGVGLRFYRLGEPLWLDEAMSARIAAGNLWTIPAALRAKADPPLFLLLGHGWIFLFGATDTALHCLTACLGVLGIGATWWAGNRMAGRGAGLAAAALLAMHPFHIVHSQEFRPYGLLVVLSAISCGLLFQALREDGRRGWTLFAVAALANLYTHNYAVFLLAAQGTCVAVAAQRDGRWPSRRNLLLAGSAIALGYAPWIASLFRQVQNPIYSHMNAADWVELLKTFGALSGVWVPAGPNWVHIPRNFAAALLIINLFLLAAAFGFLAKRKIELSLRLWTLIIVTLLIPFCISLRNPIYLGGRHSIVVLPLVCIFFGAAARRASSAKWKLGPLVFFAILSSGMIYRYFSNPKSYDRALAHYLQTHDQPGYVSVISPSFWKLPISRYYSPAERSKTSLLDRQDEQWPAGAIVLEFQGKTVDAAQQRVLRERYRQIDHSFFGEYATAKTFILTRGD